MRITARKNCACRVKSLRMKILKKILSLCLVCALAAASASAKDSKPNVYHPYVKKVGERVTDFESVANNYRLELGDEAYTYVDFSEQVPDASFAAIRFRPNAFSLVVVEKLGVTSDAKQYAELVQLAMAEEFAAREDAEYKGSSDLGFVNENGLNFFQKAIYAEISGMPVTYVLSALVDGDRAYRLLTFATNETEDTLRDEAAKLRTSFSIPDRSANVDIKADPRSVRDYRSEVFGYRFRARGNGWFDWSDLKASNDTADVGALSSRGYGAVVMPVCWQGARPTDVAIYSIMMQQFGEDYPSDFISEQHDIEKMGATGKLLIGTEESEGRDFLYHHWIVSNDRCAYALAAWGPEQERKTKADLVKLWADFEILDKSTAGNLRYDSDAERSVNANLLNALGLHYYAAKSFRDAFRFFANASDLVPNDEAFLTNTLRSLVEVDAYHEARDWLQLRLAPFKDNQNVRSWDAWLAYQTDDRDKAIRIYRELFAAGYREDDDFSTFVSMLADTELWDELDRAYSAYTAGGSNDKTRLIQVRLLSRRERYEDALSLLDEMTTGRPFNADLVFERMSILDNMGHSAGVLELAESLIENGYRSLQTYYYKGDAEYQLRSYRAAKESFEQALKFSPGNAKLREYLDAIDQMLGQGDVSTISAAIEAIPLPKAMQKIFATNDSASTEAGYGAEFLSRISGYDYSGGKTLRETQYRKIRVVDDNGISQFSTLEFDFDPSYEHLFVNSLVVRNAAGEVLGEGDINSYYITNDEDGYEASTEKTVHLPVPSLAPGVIIEAIVSKQTSVEQGTFPLETVYLASERPIAYSALFITGKVDDIHYKTNGVSSPVKRDSAVVWEIQSPLPFRWEPLQPYYDQILPWVQLGTIGADWQSVGAEYLAKIKDKLDTTSVKDRAQRLVEGIDSVERKIEILSAYVQDEIHYKAIEFGHRAYIPKTARETMRDRYGDCKDHAVLLYAMLEAVGIDASLALVNLQQSVVPELPNTDQFNHVIVAVPTENGHLFIDTTDKDMRLGQLPPRSMAGNRALVLGDTPELVEIPKYESELTGLSIDRVVEPAGDDYIQVRETARFSGYQAAEMRAQLRSIETSEMQSSLQRWIASRYTDAELTDHFVENVFDASYDLIVEIKYTLPLETDGTFDVPGFLEAYYLEFDRIADRRFPFEFHYPLRVSATTSLKFPSSHKLDAVTKKPGSGESRFGNWRREVSETDGNWKIQFDYVASLSRFGPEDYRDFADFQRKTVAAIEQALVLR